jgi:hypothetical protein
MRRLLLIAFLLMSSFFGARAQGQPCDSTLQVSIEAISTGGTSWVFVAMVDSGSYGIVGISWNMGDAQASVENGSYINFDFVVPGTYLVCVSVTAQDSLGQYCQTTVCEVVAVNPLPTGLCDSVEVDFTGSFDNGAFTFTMNDSIGAPVLGVDWSFGDGSYGSGDPVTHLFSGNGPYEVCMTALPHGPDEPGYLHDDRVPLGLFRAGYPALRTDPDPLLRLVDQWQLLRVLQHLLQYRRHRFGALGFR